MPPDVASCVRKFIPNNYKLAVVVIRVCENVFHARTLPMQLIKMIVDKAFDQQRSGSNVDIESRIFREKLTEYATALKPRYMSQIMDLRKRKRG